MDNEQVELTEREKAVKRLQDNLFEAAMSKRFVESEEGRYLLDYITEVVSTLTNQLIGKRLEHEEYIEIRAKIDILRRIKQVLEVKADDKVIVKLQQELSLAQTGE